MTGWDVTESHKAYHAVSAFIAEEQIILGEITASEKSKLPEYREWDGLRAVGMVMSTVTKNGETSTDTMNILRKPAESANYKLYCY